MAYTYDDFYREAEKAGMLTQFSKYDLETAKRDPEFGRGMLGFKTDYNNAATDETRALANEGANQLRRQYGSYTGGGEGLDYIYEGGYGGKVKDTIGQLESGGSFDYSRNDEEQKLIDAVLNQQPFSYDPGTDPLFGSYKKSYLREGERATANALAQASAASGGVPSSYAVTAAQQAGNYYAGKLNDMIPTLEQNAHDRYQGDFAQKLNALGALQTDRQLESGEWQAEHNMQMDLLNALMALNQTEYGQYADGRNWAFQEEQAGIQNQMAQQQMADQNKQREWENAMAMYQILGYATPEIAAVLGLPYGNGGGEEDGSPGYYYNPGDPTDPIDATGADAPADPGGNGGDRVEKYVESLLSGSADNRSYAANLINNSKSLTADEKKYALEILDAYRQYGV